MNPVIMISVIIGSYHIMKGILLSKGYFVDNKDMNFLNEEDKLCYKKAIGCTYIKGSLFFFAIAILKYIFININFIPIIIIVSSMGGSFNRVSKEKIKRKYSG